MKIASRNTIVGWKLPVYFILLLIGFSSCVSHKKITYFKDVPDDVHNVPVITMADTFYNPRLQPNDVLEVSISTIDPQVSGLVGSGQPVGMGTGLSSSSTGNIPTLGASAASANSGYLIDKNGYVELSIVGAIKVGGLTTAQARDAIARKAADYFKDPIVNVRLANFKITVLGEVARPSQYIVQDEKVSILDAIGMAGDLTIFGKRNNVLLVRNINNERKFIRFDLNSSETFKSPYFYLRQGDVVYVEPAKSKAASTDAVATRNIGVLATLATVLLLVFKTKTIF